MDRAWRPGVQLAAPRTRSARRKDLAPTEAMFSTPMCNTLSRARASRSYVILVPTNTVPSYRPGGFALFSCSHTTSSSASGPRPSPPDGVCMFQKSKGSSTPPRIKTKLSHMEAETGSAIEIHFFPNRNQPQKTRRPQPTLQVSSLKVWACGY